MLPRKIDTTNYQSVCVKKRREITVTCHAYNAQMILAKNCKIFKIHFNPPLCYFLFFIILQIGERVNQRFYL